MPGSTPLRVVIVAAALAASFAGYRWWNSPERHVQRILDDVAAALSHDGDDTDLQALAAVAGLQDHLSPDIVVDLGGPSPMRGRQEVISMAARVRASSNALRIQFFDAEVLVTGDDSADVRVTAQITTRDQAGEELADARVATLALAHADQRWRVRRAELVPREGTP